MERAIKIFIPTFLVVLVVNQAFYNFCFAAYCLAAAFPRVVIMSAVVTGVLYWIKKSEDEKNQ